MKFKESEISFFYQIIGPLFVVCAFSLSEPNHLLLFMSIFGLFVSAKYRFRGFIASVVVLLLVTLMNEFYGTSLDAWNLGIQCSYVLAFYITAVSSDLHNKLVTSLFSQLKLRNSSLQILEEEFTKTQNEGTKQQILSQGKIDSLQKQLDEIIAEQSSLSMLNEVLRKTTAKHIESNEQMKSKCEALRQQLLDEEQRHRNLQEEKDRLQAELLSKIKEPEKEEKDHRLHVLEQEITHLTQVAILYKQLKVQFEEKNRILHQTRSELFAKDTELQALQIAHKELSASIPQELVDELMKIEKDLSYLQAENFDLQELVTALSASASVEPKKKVRMNPDQFSLF